MNHHVKANEAISKEPGFCPFCQESFEGLSQCPDHELELVPFSQWMRKSAAPAQDAPLSVLEPRYGRGIVFAGAALLLLSLWLPFVRVHTSVSSQPDWAVSAWQLASARAINLWTVPIAAMVAIWLLSSRRSLQRLQSLRLVMPFIAIMAAVSMGYTLFGVYRWAHRYQSEVALQGGTLVMALGVLLVLLGGARLGSWRGLLGFKLL